MNKNPGQRWLCQRLVQRLPEHGNLVIDGLRFPEDHAFLVEAFGPAFLHVHVTSPSAIRKERFIAAGGTQKKFARASAHAVEAEVVKLAFLAHVQIANTGSLEAFLSKISQVTGCEKNVNSESFACQ